jgi:UDP-N-acetylmuramoylalanine--D-glutamate ligase
MSTIDQLALQGSVDMDYSAMLFNERLLRVRNQHIRDIMSDYLYVACRMELVATVCGIDFINDAKANNLNAAWYSLENMTKPVIWIVNNIGYKEGFEKIIPLLKDKIKVIILLGNQNGSSSVFSDYVERVYKAGNIEHAVELAYTVGIQGDAVLFSPAADGYDEDYKQTGGLFSAAVKRL